MAAAVDRGDLAGRQRVRPMCESDLEQVLAIERASFPTPWRREHFQFELHEHPYASSVVLEGDGRVLGYASFWIVDDELKINNIAIEPASRGRGLGTGLLRWMLAAARRRGCRAASLEVRPSNRPARRLYAAQGFSESGRRKDYYSDTHEDAIVMTARLDGR